MLPLTLQDNWMVVDVISVLMCLVNSYFVMKAIPENKSFAKTNSLFVWRVPLPVSIPDLIELI